MGFKIILALDNFCVKVCADSLEHIIALIRANGFSLEALTSKRAYATDEPGVWRNGSAGLVRKLGALTDVADGDQHEGEGRKAKYRSCNRDRGIPIADATSVEEPVLGAA